MKQLVSNQNKAWWWRFSYHCAAGEIIGIGLAGAIAYLTNLYWPTPSSLPEKCIVLALMLVAGFIEGSALGYFQWRVLKDKWPQLPLVAWVRATVLIAVLGWFLGMLPSLFFFDADPGQAAAPPAWLDTWWATILLSSLMGAVLGLVFGFAQYLVLKHYVPKAQFWIWANSLGWSVGMVWIFVFATIPTAETSLAFNISMGVIGGCLAGLSIGGVIGYQTLKN